MTATILVGLGILALFGLLPLAAWLERNIVSPQALITSVVRARVDPDRAERVVAAEARRLLTEPEAELPR